VAILAALAALAGFALVALIGAALTVHRVASSQAIAAPALRPFTFPPFPGMHVGPPDVHATSFHAPIGAIGALVLLVGIIGVSLTVVLWRRWDTHGRWSRPSHDRDQTRQGHYS